jgi:hypothetical protein
LKKYFIYGVHQLVRLSHPLVSQHGYASFLSLAALFVAALLLWFGAHSRVASAAPQDSAAPNTTLRGQSAEEAQRKSAGCISCHTATDEPTMHPSRTVQLACTDCHGGDASASIFPGTAPNSQDYVAAKQKAHVPPKIVTFRNRPGIPERVFTQWLKESYEYIKFVNPGDLRVAPETCGSAGCHTSETRAVSTSMMTHSGMLWGAALYNNGSYPTKNTRFGESYDRDGKPQSIKTSPAPTPEETRTKGVLPELDPLYRWETSQPGNVLRVFERGGRKKSEIGNPALEENPGKPEDKLSDRGFGTELRTDPVFLGLQKTRLLDPVMSLPGTNDHPGDYRSSGCSSCHVIYANDRDAAHSADYAQYGHSGLSASIDPTVSKTEPGHPIKHTFTRSIPSSQCMICHIHPGTNMLATYFGLTWWDNEIDGDKMYPPEQRSLTEEQRYQALMRNPEASAARGLWSDNKFLDQLGSPEFNSKLKTTQFADFHGHGWVFRAVFNHDRKGNWLDKEGNPIAFEDPDRFSKAVHLADIHLEKGMHCNDCHFAQDNHGNGKIYGEPRAAVEIDCIDCHGTIRQKATLLTSGPAAPATFSAIGNVRIYETGRHLDSLRTPWGLRRFEWQGDALIQRSMSDEHKEWEVVQTADTVTPGNIHFSEKSLRAKLMNKDGVVDSTMPQDDTHLAHGNGSMTCYSCHTSWTPTCFGCHLQMTANARKLMLHNEGLLTRNYTSYNFQVLRDDIYMLGVDGTVTGHRIAPARSSCAVLVSSQNANREWLYYTQQTISGEGFSGQGYSTFVPHTVRGRETKQCSDCHVSAANDNNAWMAQLLLQGTNFMNFMGRYIYVATGKGGLEAIAVAEHDEPEAIFGSDLQRIAYPDNYKKFVGRHRELTSTAEHPGNILDLQARGEYAYTANGPGGLHVYDIANIDNKGFSERVVTSPVSPIGQRFYVPTKNALAVASPSTLAVDPLRQHLPENEEQPIHLLYGFLYVADKEEGLVIVGNRDLHAKSPGVGTLLDGNPANNFLKRAATFNPGGLLTGARRITIAGTFAYILTDKVLVVVDLNNPLAPRVTATIGAPLLDRPEGIAVQFRYAFVIDRQGMKVLDVTDLAQPKAITNALVPLSDARNIYVARTYAYVSAGKQGLAIIDVEKPDAPKLDQLFDAGGQLNDVNDVKIGMVAASAFAFVADGKNGLRVLEIVSPWDDPAHFSGFSPRPAPKLIATSRTRRPALCISKGLDRDRAVDESGNQLAVFGRRGARPLNQAETRALYVHTRTNNPYFVTDQPVERLHAREVSSADRWLASFRHGVFSVQKAFPPSR